MESEVVETNALAILSRSEIDSQIATAKRYPRDEKTCIDKAISLVTMDEETALSCFYSFPRAGKNVEGESIRLAEIVAGTWQNLRAQTRVIDETAREVRAQAVVHDLENNVAISREVSRRIVDKTGKRYSDDVIVMTCNAACSIALRNAVFTVVPRALVHKVYAAARDCALGQTKSTKQRQQACVAHFAKLGVTEETMLKHLEIASVDDITTHHLDHMLGLLRGIKAGEFTIEEAFARAPGAPERGTLSPDDFAPAEPESETEPLPGAVVDPETGEVGAAVPPEPEPKAKEAPTTQAPAKPKGQALTAIRDRVARLVSEHKVPGAVVDDIMAEKGWPGKAVSFEAMNAEQLYYMELRIKQWLITEQGAKE